MVVNEGQRGVFLPPNHPKLVGNSHHTITNLLVYVSRMYGELSR